MREFDALHMEYQKQGEELVQLQQTAFDMLRSPALRQALDGGFDPPWAVTFNGFEGTVASTGALSALFQQFIELHQRRL